ncbi:MAG: hypothetical protein R2909_14410 [Gemmatimonadales bacterium]
MLDLLKRAAQAALAKATPEDKLWLIAADGVVRPGSAEELSATVAALEPDPRRLDLGTAMTLATRILEAEGAGEVLVVSDLQRSALGQGEAWSEAVLLEPEGQPPANAGVAALTVGTQPWAGDNGVVGVLIGGTGQGSRPVTLGFRDRPSKQLLAPVGGQETSRITAPGPGWWVVDAVLDPDELRADDRRSGAVRVAPPARVGWSDEDRFVATAAQVLSQNGRIVAGDDVTLGSLGRGASVVLPPADPALIGALNRALAARGSRWRFGDQELLAATTDSGAWIGRQRVTRRHRLVHGGGADLDVLATVAGEPWLVRSGSMVLVGSRFDPDWTDLPVSAGFLPFLDGLVNRAVRGELVALSAAPGDRSLLPDRVTRVLGPAGERAIEGGAAYRPLELGIHFLMAGRDTVGALAVNPDPRETDLTPATHGELRSLWPSVRISTTDDAARLAFAAGARSDLRGPLLWLAAFLLAAEVLLASRVRKR